VNASDIDDYGGSFVHTLPCNLARAMPVICTTIPGISLGSFQALSLWEDEQNVSLEYQECTKLAHYLGLSHSRSASV
jgi:hypothetical protein